MRWLITKCTDPDEIAHYQLSWMLMTWLLATLWNLMTRLIISFVDTVAHYQLHDDDDDDDDLVVYVPFKII